MDTRVVRLCCELDDKARDPDPFRQLRAQKIATALANSKGDWCCQFCGREFERLEDVTIDHIVPKSLMKSGEEERLQLACKKCNSERGNMPIDFYKMFRIFRAQYPEHAVDAFVRLRRNREVRQERAMGLCDHRLEPRDPKWIKKRNAS